MVHLRIPKRLYAKCVQVVKDNGFSNVQELTREALRKRVENYETQAAIERLRKGMGSVENVKRLTRKEREKLYKDEMKKTKAERLELLRKFGLEDVRKL